MESCTIIHLSHESRSTVQGPSFQVDPEIFTLFSRVHLLLSRPFFILSFKDIKKADQDEEEDANSPRQVRYSRETDSCGNTAEIDIRGEMRQRVEIDVQAELRQPVKIHNTAEGG
ncbi:uncharacterized protein MCYG_04720 [Microsporum canis CBS 113480]|uniref:Uncharacterized protein n=1 Tax=Arthroderma otae (strain ATCC MYA-4605 / CBS 113480) TaxID=554155 RepID=C5FMT0_ARTOC|nr:uncharacterized protein MCYG_04720 [Microsporum canis CBS 113480]EEQ31901.1 predicted protein [Microsporum canis CBS 113480]